ncbi:MAG: hypothetical protein VX498_14155 [Myxococcota bacterium]|nr:hypothetical protein [Myxococcota bacterium]
MRSRALTERLRRMDTHFCFAMLTQLLDLAADRNPQGRELLIDLTCSRPLAESIGYEATRRIYPLAAQRERPDVSLLFLSPDGLNPRDPGEEFLKRENQKLPDQSLGWRKALARGTDRLKLDRLLFDRNPAVIQLLLANPRIIERDVVRIAAMRPTNPDNLVAVFQHPRWITRYLVKVALACNPWSPLDVALACLPHLMQPNLRYIAASAKLAPTLRSMARTLLERSESGSGSPGQPDDLYSDLDLDKLEEELDCWRVD